jgi:predicted ArsR family transcriptional regulator
MEEQTKSKQHILYLLKTEGAQSATELADRLNVSPMAVRQHLQKLHAERLIEWEERRQPVGRPVKYWHLTDRATPFFPDRHAELMTEVLGDLQASLGSSGMAKLLEERTQRQLHNYRVQLDEGAKVKDWRDCVIEIAKLRTREGYMAEAIELSDRSMLLVENHCPIACAAETCNQFCHSEFDIFRQLLGSEVEIERVEHLLQGDRRCAYRIRAKRG